MKVAQHDPMARACGARHARTAHAEGPKARARQADRAVAIYTREWRDTSSGASSQRAACRLRTRCAVRVVTRHACPTKSGVTCLHTVTMFRQHSQQRNALRCSPRCARRGTYENAHGMAQAHSAMICAQRCNVRAPPSAQRRRTRCLRARRANAKSNA